jgi:hypothetical protein
MAKKKKTAKKKPVAHKPRYARPPTRDSGIDPGPLDVALYVTYAGEAALRIVEFSQGPLTDTIQEFPVHMQEVSARSTDPVFNTNWARDVAREIFRAHDKSEQPYLRVIGRVLDELLAHRRKASCSGGDVYLVLLSEIDHELPAAHRQRAPFDRTLNPGRRSVDNRLRELKGESREDGKGSGPAYVVTTSTTKGGAEQGYRLTEEGRWLFDGWPELPELVQGRSRAT